MNNEKSKGVLSYFLFYDSREKEYVGICVELGMLRFGSDLNKLKEDLQNASKGYVETIIKNDLSENLLNQELPEEYKELYSKFIEFLNEKSQSFGKVRQNVFTTKIVDRV